MTINVGDVYNFWDDKRQAVLLAIVTKIGPHSIYFYSGTAHLSIRKENFIKRILTPDEILNGNWPPDVLARLVEIHTTNNWNNATYATRLLIDYYKEKRAA